MTVDAWDVADPCACPACGRESCEDHLPPDETRAAIPGRRSGPAIRVFDDVEILGQPDPEPLIPGYWMAASTSCTAAPPGFGKSALSIAANVAIAANRAWMGVRPAKSGPTAMIIGEGASHMKLRVLAAKIHFGLDLDQPVGFHVLPEMIDFRNSRSVDALIERLRPISLVRLTIDTLTRAMPGGADKEQADIGIVTANCDRVRQALGCAIEWLHHTGYDETRERGSSAIRANVDTMALIERGSGGDLVLKCTKQKDAPEFEDLLFTLLPIDLGPGADGRPRSACVAVPADAGRGKDDLRLSDAYRLAFQILATLRCGATQRQWFEAMPTQFGSGEAKRQKLYRARRALLQAGLIKADKGRLFVSQTAPCNTGSDSCQ
jgi:hypothetical protein